MRDALGGRSASRLYLNRPRDRVFVVLDQEQDWQLEIAGGVQRFPPLAFARCPIARGAVDDFIAVDRLVLHIGVLAVPQPCLGAADRLQELRARRARLADDVEILMPPMGPHLPPAPGWILSRADR